MELISSPPMLSSRVSLVSKQLPRVRRGQGPVNLTYGSKDRYIILYGVKGEEESEVTGVPFEEGSKETTDFWEVCMTYCVIMMLAYLVRKIKCYCQELVFA